MAGTTYTLEIITPRKIVFKGEVASFTAPGIMGGFQVLVSHAPLLSEITVGEVKLTDAAGSEFRYATSGGFVEVNDNHVMLLAETAERPEDIDVQRAEAARARAQRRLADHGPDTDIERARFALQRALNRLHIAGQIS